jgi:hypothetical protein
MADSNESYWPAEIVDAADPAPVPGAIAPMNRH